MLVIPSADSRHTLYKLYYVPKFCYQLEFERI